ALGHDLRGAVLGDVLGEHQHPAGAGHQVHRAAHALDDLARDRPVGEVAAGRYLHPAENPGPDGTGTVYPGRRPGVEAAAAWRDRDGLLPGVDQVGVLLAREREL